MLSSSELLRADEPALASRGNGEQPPFGLGSGASGRETSSHAFLSLGRGFETFGSVPSDLGEPSVSLNASKPKKPQKNPNKNLKSCIGYYGGRIDVVMPLLVLLHHGQIFLWDEEEEAAAARALYAWGVLVVFFFSPKETPLQGDAYVSLSAFLHRRREWVRTCRLLDEQRLRFHQQVSCGSWRGIGGRASMGSLKLRAEMLEIISCFSNEQIFVRSFGRLPLSSAYMGWDTRV